MAKKKKHGFKLFLLLICSVLILSHCGLSSAVFRSTVRKQLASMFGSEVRMEDAAFSALTGRGTIASIRILNPADYPAGDAITIERVAFKFEQSSFWGDRTVVNELTLERGTIHYQESGGGSNITGILASIEEYSEKYPSDRAMVIDRLIIKGWKCRAKFSPDDTHPTEFNIPDVEIVGLRGTSAEIGKKISIEIATQIREKLRSPGTLLQRSKNVLLSTMENVGRGSKDLVMDFIDALTGKSRSEDGVEGDGKASGDPVGEIE